MSLPIYYITTQDEINKMKSNLLISVNCENCSKIFSIQKKKFTFTLKHNNTYRTTCSLSCFRQLISKNNTILTNCKTCNKEIFKHIKEIEQSKSGFVFCSTSCAAKINNTITKLKYLHKICLNCSNEYKDSKRKNSQTCSPFCLMEYNMKTKNIIKTSSTLRTIRSNARTYSKYFYLPKCALCDYDKHFEVCHINPISNFSNTTLFEINNKDNLIHLCPNCHWEFDHGKIKLEIIKEAQKSSAVEQ